MSAADAPLTYHPSTVSTPTRAGPPGLHVPTRALSAFGGPLGAGLHLVAGAHGAGKTQWLVQVAVEAASMNRPAALVLPDVAPAQAVLRVAGALSGQGWAEISTEAAETQLERISGAPFTLHALDDISLEALPLPESGLVAVDLPVDDLGPRAEALRALRLRALESDTLVWASWPSAHEERELLRPADTALAYGVSQAGLAVADSVWVLVPSSRSSYAIHCAKSRSGPPGVANILFTGGRFEDERDMELSLDDV